jgi:carbon-monoxide dehydrogenase medium subunit
MKPVDFDYARPEQLEDAIALMAANRGEAKIIAGGQSLIPMLAFRLAAPRLLVDIGRIQNLNRIAVGPDGVRLGSLVRWRDIERDAKLGATHPLLCEAVRHVAHYQIRNRGTVGGSLAHADPAAELPGVAVACDAQIAVAGPHGTRRIAAAEFFTGPLMTALAPDEVITELHLPAWPRERRWAFDEFSRRRGDFALSGVLAFYDRADDGSARDPHIAGIGIGDRPMRLEAAETALNGKRVEPKAIAEAAAAAGETIEVSDDIHAPADYRRALLQTLIERALTRTTEGA